MKRTLSLRTVRRLLVPTLVGGGLLLGSSGAFADTAGMNDPYDNIVQVSNYTSDSIQFQGHVQLNEITDSNAQPVNEAFAYGSCSHCQTFAVALQIDLVSTHATNVQPQNYSVALNYQCSYCTTVSDAYQYVLSVPDPTQVPANVTHLVNEMDSKLQRLGTDNHLTVAEAQQQINTVLAQFRILEQHLNKNQQKDTHSND